MATLPFRGLLSSDGRSVFERGTATEPFSLKTPQPPAQAAAPAPPKGDIYPGDDKNNRILQELLASISDGGTMRYRFYDLFQNTVADGKTYKGKKEELEFTRDSLIEHMVVRISTGIEKQAFVPENATDKTAVGMTMTDLEWLTGSSTATQQSALIAALKATLSKPSGYAQSEAATGSTPARGFGRWHGHHQGHWFNGFRVSYDPAIWMAPEDKYDAPTGRTFRLQTVYWPKRTSIQWGWNLSDKDTPFVWGWDPKEIATPASAAAGGSVGPHLGLPATWAGCDFILWLTPTEVFLEGVNRTWKRKLKADGVRYEGYPKISANLGSGYGQWVVVP